MSSIQLKVVIVGGGIGGLTAALALRRQGHALTVFESSSWLQETGAAVGIPPNAARVLIELGIDPKQDTKGAALQRTNHYEFTGMDRPPRFGKDGDGKHIPWAERVRAMGLQNLYWFAHRVDLHDAIKKKCVNPEGAGIPVKITLASKVVAWNPAGSIKLDNGTHITADLIIAADGIHSVAHEIILGHRFPVKPSGITNMRFLLNTSDILDDPDTAKLLDDGPGCFAFYANSDRKAYLLRFPCRNNEMQNFGAYAFTGDTQTLARERVSRDDLLKRLDCLPSIIQAIGRKSGDYSNDWKIADRDPIPSYCRDRLVVIGDAAHPMWPRQGQGAAQSIEDAATLGILMSGLNNQSDVPERLKLFNQLRVRRTSIIQLLSRTREMDNGGAVPEDVYAIFEKWTPDFRPSHYEEVSKWIWGHDCIGQAQSLLRSEHGDGHELCRVTAHESLNESVKAMM